MNVFRIHIIVLCLCYSSNIDIQAADHLCFNELEAFPVQVTAVKVYEPGVDGFQVNDLNRILVSDEATIQITLSHLSSEGHDNWTCRYRLNSAGGKADWVDFGESDAILLTGMRHGLFNFEVSARNCRTLKEIEGSILEVQVISPFYKRPVFIELLFIPASILMLTGFRYRTRSLRKNNRILKEKEIVAKEVLRQKNLLSRRNRSIEDSLKYAQRIQYAMFTNEREIREMFPNSFILQKPKDIVSGDFFWARRVEGKIFLAAVDCTGHGVPGAFMSLIGLEFFRQIIAVKKEFKPALILNQLNERFDDLFGGEQDISLKDGMDVSLCAFDLEKQSLEYAGAFNPLYIIRNGELIVIKGDKTTIGPDMGFLRKPFKNHRISLETNDMIYMFSDGFADQFGGPEGKKFKYRRFRHLLLSMYEKPVEIQYEMLSKSIVDWQGDLEQVDDMLVIGVKVTNLHNSIRN